MGSMMEIMKKVRDEGDAPDPAVEGVVEPMPQNAAPDASGPGAAGSRFTQSGPEAVSDLVAEAASVAFPSTQEWNAKLIDRAVVAFHARYSVECEQFRSIRARLLSMNSGGAPCVLAITSSVPGEGKSTCTVNLGIVMAEGGEQRTLIVDADLRRASITRMLGLDGQSGLSDLLRGTSSVKQHVYPTPFAKLKVLPAGAACGASQSELLGSARLREVFTELRAAFDYVFVDMPPVSTVADASVLGPRCDAALLVLQMHRTPEPVAQQAVRTLQANKVRVLGCILTRHHERHAHMYDINEYYNYGS